MLMMVVIQMNIMLVLIMLIYGIIMVNILIIILWSCKINGRLFCFVGIVCWIFDFDTQSKN